MTRAPGGYPSAPQPVSAPPGTGRPWRRWHLWLAPGMGVKRHVAWAAFGAVTALTGAGGLALWVAQRPDGFGTAVAGILGSDARWVAVGGWVSTVAMLAGAVLTVAAIGRLTRSILSHWTERPQEAAATLHRELVLARGLRVVAIGGGTGLSRLLRGLRPLTSNLTAIVAVSDDGGSSGRLRSAFAMPAPGDLNDCLAALSADEAALGRLLEHRFARGDELEGHTFGNLLITTLTEAEADFGDALRAVQRLLDLGGAVWPATVEAVTLRVEKADGRVIVGEHAVREAGGPARTAMIEPEAPRAMPEALAALNDAELIVVGPGSLFTSTLAPLLVPEVAAALRASPGRLVQVVNIMTEAGETDGFDAWGHVATVERHLGRRPDLVVVNATPLDARRRDAYAAEGAEEVAADAAPFRAAGVPLVAWPLLADGSQAQHDSDALARSLVAWSAARRRR